MSYAEPADVALRMGVTFEAAQDAQVQALLDDVETVIRSRIADLDSRADSDDTFSELLRLVEIKAVRRVMLNPTGLRQTSESIDDHSESYTFDSAISASDVYLTDSEWALLIGDSAAAGSFHAWGGYC